MSSRNWLAQKDSNLYDDFQRVASYRLNDMPTEMVDRVGLEPTLDSLRGCCAALTLAIHSMVARKRSMLPLHQQAKLDSHSGIKPLLIRFAGERIITLLMRD